MWHIIRTAIMSILILVLIHQIYNHLQYTLTSPIATNRANIDKKYAEIETILNS